MSETLQLPALQIHGPADCNGLEGNTALSSSCSPSLRRKRFKMRRMKNVMSEKEQLEKDQLQRSGSKEYLQLPSIEITPSSDEDAAWSRCSTPSASPQRRRFLLRKWLRGGDKKEHGSESSSQQSSLQSSHEEESTRYLSPNTREDRAADVKFIMVQGKTLSCTSPVKLGCYPRVSTLRKRLNFRRDQGPAVDRPIVSPTHTHTRSSVDCSSDTGQKSLSVRKAAGCMSQGEGLKGTEHAQYLPDCDKSSSRSHLQEERERLLHFRLENMSQCCVSHTRSECGSVARPALSRTAE
ncbi:hypothetical protein E1301_Tti000146 [Triplophysa tibetana]|uniref:GRAM domain-containing protein 1B n=1 Tax=Triplophysa tibetana TaxID=1572043 RepID=A0A5A9N4G4_9TELE|nr:hypothetical protein E1301_Tti000146 [Triplophysa tibetana]